VRAAHALEDGALAGLDSRAIEAEAVVKGRRRQREGERERERESKLASRGQPRNNHFFSLALGNLPSCRLLLVQGRFQMSGSEC
jgi:hypothetical protein